MIGYLIENIARLGIKCNNEPLCMSRYVISNLSNIVILESFELLKNILSSKDAVVFDKSVDFV